MKSACIVHFYTLIRIIHICKSTHESCYTCMYSLSLGNLHQWFHWHTTWIDIIHSKEKLPGKQEQVKTRLLEMAEEEHAAKMRNLKKKISLWKSVSLKIPSLSTTKKAWGFLILYIRKHVLHGYHFRFFFLVSLYSKTMKWCRVL